MSFFQVISFAFSMIMQMSAAKAARKRQKRMEQEAKERADAAKGFIVPVEGEASLLPIPYGRNMLGGVRVRHLTSSNFTIAQPASGGYLFQKDLDASRAGVKHEFLTVQGALCFSGIHNIITVDVNGRLFSDPKFAAKTGDSDGLDAGRLMGGHRIHVYPKGNIVDPLMSNNHSLSPLFTNTAYYTGVFALNRDDYQYSGVPDVRFYVEGMEVPEIIGPVGAKVMSTKKSYSNNPARCLLDYLTNSIYGRGLPVEYIDLESFAYAEKVCERVVLGSVPKEGNFWNTKGGLREVKLYECNLSLSSGKPIRENIETLLETMGQAELIWSGGKYKLSIEYPLLYDSGLSYQQDDVVQVIQANDVDLYRSLVNSNNSPLTDLTKWKRNVIAAYIDDTHLIRGSENSIAWPNAQERYNYATVRFLNEAKDFVEDSVSWPPKEGSIQGQATDRGAWSQTGVYGYSDIVSRSGNKWQLNTSGVVYQGEYDAGKAYVKNDVVSSTGTLYKAKGDAHGNLPTDTLFWVDCTNISNTLAPGGDPAWVIYNDNLVYNIYRQQDHGLPLEVDFFETGTTDYYHALAKAEQRVRFSRTSAVYKFVLATGCFDLEPADLIKVTSDVLNIPGEVLRIEEVKITTQGNVEITASKFDAANLAWNANDNEVVMQRNLFNTELGQCTNLVFSTINTNDTFSPGTLSWTAPSDIRVKEFIIKYTLVPVENVTNTTVWYDLGKTSTTSFGMPSMPTSAYTLTVVASSGTKNGVAPRNNGVGSKWPLLGIGLNAIVINTTTYIPVSVYKRASTVPSIPIGGVFDFTTMSLTTLPTGWSAGPPTGSEALYISTTVASTEDTAIPDTTLVWNTPLLFTDASISVNVTKTSLGVGQNFEGQNAIFTEALGNFEVKVGSNSFSLSDEAQYTIVTQNHCTLTINNTNGSPTKGRYAVTELTAVQGDAKLRCTFRGTTYDFIVFVVALKDVYIKDLTPPPTPTGISAVAGLTNIFVTLSSIPTFTEGHGHSVVRVYGAVGANPIFSSATRLGDFMDIAFAIPRKINEQMHLWFKYVSRDGVESVTPMGGTNGITATTSTISNADLGISVVDTINIAPSAVTNAKIVANAITSDKISANSISSGHIAANSISSGHITGGSISAGHIAAGAVTSDKMSVGSLSAISATLGSITSGNITMNTTSSIKAGQTAYATGTGFYLGYDSTAYKFSIGTPTTGLKWDGSSLSLNNCAINVNNLFTVNSAGTVSLKSASTGARLEITNSVIKVYDGSGVLRVKIGDLNG